MPEFSQLDLKETLDITPTVDIFFRLSKPNWMEAQEEILVATLKLIARFPWDIALFHSYSATILVRKESQLALSANEYSWKPELLRLISMPYELKELPIV